MPYILPEERDRIDGGVAALHHALQGKDQRSWSAGRFNYAISRLLHVHLISNLRYADLNECIGVLECIKQELYRKVAAPYEDKKLHLNGAVSTLDEATMEDVR